ncbi:MAG: LURP-one-related family protein [Oscillospiraceae bacterium]|nr:LURP-one-related family protein [Oscillospiraceae bacterium]
MYSIVMMIPFILIVACIALLIYFTVAKARSARFREAGEGTDERTLSEYGVPARSLYTSTEFFSFRHHIEITDEAENLVYDSTSKFLSFRDKTDITRADGTPVAHIEKKILSLHQRHFVTMADGTEFELSTELLHLIKDIINIEGLGWQIRGNILQMNFELLDGNENIIAVIGQKFLSLHDKYSIDIYQPQYEETIIAILVCLQHIVNDREAASSASSSSSSSSSSASG